MTGPAIRAPRTAPRTAPRLTPERWRAVEAVLHGALDREPEARAAYLDGACRDDPALRREVESLLAAAPADDFLEPTPPAVAAPTRARLAAALADRYAIERELGRGGMATVYLARDLRHRRPVALKVLHPELSAALGTERFLKEIELTASLQHPHVLPLFDSGGVPAGPPHLEEWAQGGLLYYVMPYVDGETLRARLARERELPIAEAVRLAREVADALAYAHARGVVHRDVKPENVLLHDGRALVADFGIALAVREAGGARMTRTGLSLGTPPYMAPEQAAGDRVVDARADVYALGAVLYEMLTGEPPFTAPTVQGMLARVLRERPMPPTALRDTIPSHVEAAVLAALEKLPADRHASASAFAVLLAAPPGAARGEVPRDATRAVPRATPHAAPRVRLSLAAGGLAVVALAAALAWTSGAARERARGIPAPARGPVRFAIDVDAGALGGAGLAISPDGRTIVFRREGADGARLWARRLDALDARPLPDTDDGAHPFFSPDGAWVAFHAGGALRRVRLDGAPASTILESVAGTFEGGVWGPGDTIHFVTASGRAVHRVSAAGGAATRVPLADSAWSIGDPHLLPDGRALLVTVSDGGGAPGVGVLELASGRVRRLGAGAAPRYAAGHLVYADAAGDLYRMPFDPGRRAPRGPAQRLASGLARPTEGVPFDLSAGGALVYRAGAERGDPAKVATFGELRLSVTSRAGRELRHVPARTPWAPRFSPDGRALAYGAIASGYGEYDLWVTDVETGATRRVTMDGSDNNDPQWSPDGRTLAYSAKADGAKDLFLLPLDGGPARALTRRWGNQFSHDWFRDGHAVLFVDESREGVGAGSQDLWVQPVDGSAPRPFVATPANERGARVSPDGRWVAYTSNETGRDEVHVESYPTPGRHTIVSEGGGIHPVWRGDGRELYYWQGERLVAAQLAPGTGGGPLAVRARATLFEAPYPGGITAMYDVSADGRRFALSVRAERATRLVVVLDALSAAPAER